MQKVVFITGHYFESRRKAGFHWLADAYWRAGWEVMFFTAWISLISRLRRDHRFNYPVIREAKKIKWIRDRLASYVWYTPWHPAGFPFRFLNWITTPWFRRYGHLDLGEAETYIKSADLFIFESTPGLLLFDRFRQLNPAAGTVYRVSDPLSISNLHPVVFDAENRFAPEFDLISTTSEYSLRQFSGLSNTALHYHGIRKEIFDKKMSSPYPNGSYNVIFVGNSHLDTDFLTKAADLFPQWTFHIIGPFSELPSAPNLIAYGEMPFGDTVPYVKHADIGLQTRSYCRGAEHLTDTLKVQQYTYCHLPIIVPDFLRSNRTNIFCYHPGDRESIRRALQDASACARDQIDPSIVPSWDDVYKNIEQARIRSSTHSIHSESAVQFTGGTRD